MKQNLFTKISLLLLFTIITLNRIVAQDDYARWNMQVQFPNSPNAASLGRYGEFPVNLQNGLIDISVPLYTAKSRKISVPLSVSYHASGIKVDDVASWVGLGWALNAGGVITRAVKGSPDEQGNGWFNQYSSIPDVGNLDFDNDTHWYYIKNVFDGKVDAQPDVYYYNFNGHSGNFRYGNDGKPYTESLDNLRIEKQYPNFIITTPDGTLYRFGRGLDGSNAREETSITPQNIAYEGEKSTITAWYLTEIISADKSDTVFFKYNTTHTYSDYAVVGQSGTVVTVENESTGPYYSNSRSSTSVRGKYLSSIIFANGKVELNPSSDRMDGDVVRLASIDIYEKRNSSYSKVKSIYLDNNHYFNRSAFANKVDNSTYHTSNEKSLKLNSLEIRDASNNKVQQYSFAYNTTTLPPRETTAQDHWGYFNGQGGNQDLIPRTSVSLYGLNFVIGDADREPSQTYMQAAMLNKITYPTGGYTQFYYEGNRYGTGAKLAGGARISLVKSYTEGKATADLEKKYVYGNGNLVNPGFNNNYKMNIETLNATSSGGPFPGNKTEKSDRYTVSSNQFVDWEHSGASKVEYQNVTEFFGKENANVGKKTYTYSTSFFEYSFRKDKYFYFGFFVFPEYRSSVLTDVNTYKNSNGQYVLVAKEHYIYDTLNTLAIKCFKPLHKVIDNTSSYQDSPVSRSGRFRLENFWIKLGKRELIGVIKKIYDTNGTNLLSEEVTDYTYDDVFYQLKSTEKKNSKNDLVKSVNYYPYQKNELTGLDPEAKDGLDRLVSNWQLGEVVQENTYQNGAIIKSNRKNFKVNSANIPLVRNIQESYLGGAYENVYNVLAYDAYANPTNAIAKDGVKQSYLWNYNHALPVARVINATNNPGETIKEGAVTASISVPGVWNSGSGTLITNMNVVKSHVAVLSLSSLVKVSSPQTRCGVTFYIKDQNTNAVVGQKTIYSDDHITQASFSLIPGLYKLEYSKVADIEFSGTFKYQRKDITYNRINEVVYESFENYPSAVSVSTAKTGRYAFRGAYSIQLNGVIPGTYHLTYFTSSNGEIWNRRSEQIEVSIWTKLH